MIFLEKEKTLSTEEEIKIFSDPYRIRILTIFKNLGKPATVKEIADLMKEVPSKVHYHIKKLESIDVLKLIYTREINGIIAKYYEPTAESFAIGTELDNSPIDDVIKDEIRKLIVNLYDESRNIILDYLSERGDNIKSKERSSIVSKSVYLTEEEFKEFNQILEEFYYKHREKKLDGKKYHLFNTIFYIDDKVE